MRNEPGEAPTPEQPNSTTGTGRTADTSAANAANSANSGVARRRFLASVGATAAGAGMLAEPATASAADTAPGPDEFRADPLLLVPDAVLLPNGPERGHAVLIANGTFRDIGPAEHLLARHSAKTVQLPGQLLMPGFVDAHHHLTQSFGKAQAFGQPSEAFTLVWEPLEQSLTEQTAHTAALSLIHI